jgi:hypothetical protein
MPSSQRWTFFTIGIIYSDLLNEKQGLINTYYSGEEKFMNYFMYPQEQCTNEHANIQPKNMYGYFSINSAKFGFMNFYTEKY